MKLDSRIKEGKKPFGCFETEEAKKFIGKECYFSDYECCFESLDLNKWKDVIVGTLLEVSDTGSDPYRSRETWFAYCVPLEFTENIQKNSPTDHSLSASFLQLLEWVTRLTTDTRVVRNRKYPRLYLKYVRKTAMFL